MNMYRLMLIGVEVKDESKVFEYLRHSFLFNVSAAKIGIIPETSKKNAQKLIEEKRAVSGARAGARVAISCVVWASSVRGRT